MSRTPWIRRVEVLLGPLTEAQGGGAEAQALLFTSTGGDGDLRIKFQTQQATNVFTFPTTISLYNLSNDTKRQLRGGLGLQVILRAGWGTEGAVELFKGAVWAMVSHREGADICTDLQCFPSDAYLRESWTISSFGEGSKLVDAVWAIATQMFNGESGHVDAKNIRVPDVSFGNQGWNFAGPCLTVLNELGRIYGFTPRVEGGQFYALTDNEVGPAIVEVDADTGDLLRVEPILSLTSDMGNRLAVKGVNVTAFLNPYVRPFNAAQGEAGVGNLMRVKSVVNPQLNGEYKILSVSHAGDSHGEAWVTTMESYMLGAEFGSGPPSL